VLGASLLRAIVMQWTAYRPIVTKRFAFLCVLDALVYAALRSSVDSGVDRDAAPSRDAQKLAYPRRAFAEQDLLRHHGRPSKLS